jgi:flagellar M-ring protein FliF
MDFLKKIALIWQKISLIQRALLTGVVITVALIGSLLVHWARKPDMTVLYHGLAPSEAYSIVEKIAENNIAYELRDGGTTICVPKQNVYELRIALAKEGLPADNQSGYKIFDEEKIGISPFVENVNLKRALQDELAKSIQLIDGVAHARVHIVDADEGLFSSKENPTSASVVLRIKPGYSVSSINIAAITHLVSGAVKGLKAENVTVIDSQGRLLSGDTDPTITAGAGTVQDYKERVEQNLSKKVENMLTAVLGPGRASVQVSAVLDMNSVSTVTETYNPETKVSVKEEETKTAPSIASGSNASAGEIKQDSIIKTEFEVGKTVTQEVVLPGTIKSLSVAAFVDLYPDDVNDAESGAQAQLIMQQTDVQQIIQNALGLKDTDPITVVNARFHKPIQAFAEEEPSNWPRYLALARQLSLAIFAICALLVFRTINKARKKAAAEIPQAQIAAGTVAGLLPSGVNSSEPLMLRRQIASAMRKNPEQVRELFQNWLQEK